MKFILLINVKLSFAGQMTAFDDLNTLEKAIDSRYFDIYEQF